MVEAKQDEVSLADLWRVLVQERKVVALVWVLCTLIGLAYALLATPVYKVESFMLPPSHKDINPLNIKALGEKFYYTPAQIYNVFEQTLRSRSNRRDFYHTNQIASQLGLQESDDPNVFFEKKFNEKLVVQRDLKKAGAAGFLTVSLEGESVSLLSPWLNRFVASTAATVREQLVKEVYANIEGRKLALMDAIAGKLQLAKKRRADRIMVLKEALLMAKALSDNDKMLQADVWVKGIAMNTSSIPLYMLSMDALNAEMNVLANRKDDAPFVPGLRDLEEKVATFEQVSIDGEGVLPMFLDQKAEVPVKPIKPKKALIVILSCILGLLLGILIAFVYLTVRNKERES